MFLTVKDVSDLLKIKASTIYSWAAQGKIPSRKINGVIRFWSEDIAAWLASFSEGEIKPIALNLASNGHGNLDVLIARAKQEVYNPRHGETRPRSSLTRREEKDGAL